MMHFFPSSTVSPGCWLIVPPLDECAIGFGFIKNYESVTLIEENVYRRTLRCLPYFSPV
jgi:hypothetical protein